MMNFSTFPQRTPLWVARTLGTPLPPDSFPSADRDRPFSALCTDSRKVLPGCLFVPLKGEKFDAHDFIAEAVGRGALGILHAQGRLPPGIPPEMARRTAFFPVEDTLEAYRRLAAAWRKCFRIPVVMVAGSAGKTTTKELLAACLRGRWPDILKTQGSQNGFVGIPMTLLDLEPRHGAAVIEVGIDEIGAMRRHIELLRPDFSVLTAVGPEHLERLRDLETVAREERIALTAVAESGGQVAVNLDDPWISPCFESLSGARRRVAYGMNPDPDDPTGGPGGAMKDRLLGRITTDLRFLEVRGGGFGRSDGGREERFELPLPGGHNALNLLGAIAVCELLGLSASEIRGGLATFTGAEGRSQIRELPVRGGHVQVLCDYYNAQPASVTAALELLSQLARREGPPRSQWVCLGDMLELGHEEQKYHRELADPILRLGIDHVLLHGPRMKWLEDELVKRGFTGTVRHLESHSRMAKDLRRGLGDGAVLLIKGSRGMTMEAVWKELER